jgi:thiamine-phosphate pyrophosphorylase
MLAKATVLADLTPMTDRRGRLSTARLYLVCDARGDAFLEAALRGGVDIVQLRLKDAPDDEVITAARRFAAACAAHDALFVLNDRPDLVLAAGADGVHVGQDDNPVGRARELVGRSRIVGLSTHTPAQIEHARRLDVDYIGVGPVHATPTKPGRPAVGLELVRYAAAHAPVPFFAIGGIDARNVAAVRGAGASRVAAVRALTESVDPERAARELRAAVVGHGRRGEVPLGRA